MTRFFPTGVAGFLMLAAAVVALAGSAIAYFESQGGGTASAAVAKLTAPNLTAATAAAGGTVTLTWSAASAPSSPAVTYYVERDGEAAGGTCPTEASPTTVVTCTDKNVTIGAHTYQVTAVWNAWTTKGTTKAATVAVGAVTKFDLEATPTAIVAGTGSANLKITAQDEKGSTVSTYTGSKTLTFSGAAAAPNGTKATVSNSSGTATSFGTGTGITFTSGVASVNSTTRNGVLRIYAVGTHPIVATEGSITTPVPEPVTVTPATTNKFILAAATTTPTAGVGDNLTITAQDAYGNLATGYTGVKSLVFAPKTEQAGNVPTATDSEGNEIPFGTATGILFDAGVAKAAEGDGGSIKLVKSATAHAVKVTEGSVTTPTAVNITPVAAAASKLVLTPATTTPVVGTGFNITTTAQDVYGNTAVSYTGSKSITFSGAEAGPNGTLPTVANSSSSTGVNFGSVTALSFSSGVATVSSSKNGFTRLYKQGATNISATDGTISTPAAATVTVGIGPAARLAIWEPVLSAGTVGSPCLHTCTITGIGNSGTLKADIAVTDAGGYLVSNIGSGKSAKVVGSGSSGYTLAGTPVAFPETGSAISTTEFTYTAPSGTGAFSNTLKLESVGATYTAATITVNK